MLRKIFISIGILSLCFGLIGVKQVSASGVLHAKIGENILLNETSNNSGNLKWILKQDNQIVETKEGRTFSYIFKEEGEYEIILNLVNASNVTDSKIKVFVGDEYILPAPISTESGVDLHSFEAVLDTLPPVDSDGVLYLRGDSGAVTFMSSASKGEIAEYRIDSNVYYDSDGNGDRADDIDNQNDVSYLTGSAWTTEYQRSWGNIATKLTIVGKNGEKTSSQYSIVFADKPDLSGTLEAKLLNLPRQNTDDQKIYLAGDQWTVIFLSNLSKWEIREYRIDKNIYFDSNGDGSPANDIDNFNHPSFKTGENFETDYAKAWGKTVAQLTVVSAEGKGSLVQREIVFDDNRAVKSEIQADLWADKTEISVNDSIHFEVKNAQAGETYKWDFNGDSVVDLKTESSKASQAYDQAGEYLVTLLIENAKGEKSQRNQRVIVKKSGDEIDLTATQWPLVEFEYMLNGAKVIFQNQSAVDPTLANQEIRSEWDFGDGTTGTENSPEHLYPEIATYTVKLMVTDSVGRVNSKETQITINGLEVATETGSGAEIAQWTGVAVVEDKPEGNTIFPTEEKSLIWWIISVLLYLIGGLLLLVIGGLGGYLIYLKIKSPDFTFAELIEEEKNKFFGKGAPVEIPAPPKPMTAPAKPNAETVPPKPQTTTTQPTQTENKAKVVNNAEVEGETVVPAWLQQAQQKAIKKTEPVIEKPISPVPEKSIDSDLIIDLESEEEIEETKEVPAKVEPIKKVEPIVPTKDAEQPKVNIPPVVEPKISTTPVVEPKVVTTPIVEPKISTTPVVEPKISTTPVVEPKVATASVVEPKVATTPVVEPKVATTPVAEPKIVTTPVVEPKVATAPVVEPKVSIPQNESVTKKTDQPKPELKTEQKQVQPIASKVAEPKAKVPTPQEDKKETSPKKKNPPMEKPTQKLLEEKTKKGPASKISTEHQEIPREKKEKSNYQEIPLEDKKTNNSLNQAQNVDDDIPDWLK